MKELTVRIFKASDPTYDYWSTISEDRIWKFICNLHKVEPHQIIVDFNDFNADVVLWIYDDYME